MITFSPKDMTHPPNVVIRPPQTEWEYDEVKSLFIEYADTLGFSLDYQGFQQELDELPLRYAPPTGALLIANVDGIIVGTVAMRKFCDGICEMKRLYVKLEYRNQKLIDGNTIENPTTKPISIGRALTFRIIQKARELGYERMRLDTVPKMVEAIRLYRSFGFVEIPAYYDTPIQETVFMELVLSKNP